MHIQSPLSILHKTAATTPRGKQLQQQLESAAGFRPVMRVGTIVHNGVLKQVRASASTIERMQSMKRRQAIHQSIALQMTALGRLFTNLSEIDSEMYDQNVATLFPTIAASSAPQEYQAQPL